MSKIPNLRYHATRVGLFKIPLRTLNSTNLKTPCLVQDFGHRSHVNQNTDDSVSKIPNFRYHGNKDRFLKFQWVCWEFFQESWRDFAWEHACQISVGIGKTITFSVQELWTRSTYWYTEAIPTRIISVHNWLCVKHHFRLFISITASGYSQPTVIAHIWEKRPARSRCVKLPTDLQSEVHVMMSKSTAWSVNSSAHFWRNTVKLVDQ